MTTEATVRTVRRKRQPRASRVLTTVLSTRLPISLVETMDAEAEKRGIFTSELIRETLEARFNVAEVPSTLFG